MVTIDGLNFEAGIRGLADGPASVWGFRSGDRGTHTSRTIMLDELSHLLDAVPGDVTREVYVDAVVDGNCLGKRTAANPRLSLQRLTELYGLNAQLILFRVLRDLWGRHESSRPLLGLLLALARDPLLGSIASVIIRTPFGHEFARETMKEALSEAVGDRLNESTLNAVLWRASSSWTQSGHLQGRVRKTRQRAQPTPVATAYALLLGYLCDWINRQQDGVRRGDERAEERLAAAMALQKRLIRIIQGDPPFDIFVRWKPIDQQPLGWVSDINHGVRLNIRPFMTLKMPGGRKGAGILRTTPKFHWKKDRDKEPIRDQNQFPWFWNRDQFIGDRVNDVHLTLGEKRHARNKVAI